MKNVATANDMLIEPRVRSETRDFVVNAPREGSIESILPNRSLYCILLGSCSKGSLQYWQKTMQHYLTGSLALLAQTTPKHAVPQQSATTVV
jgi:hypothetical protein